MKKLVISTILILIYSAAFAQVSIGLGAEFNMNSRENFAGGGVFSFDYGFADVFAVGAAFTASSNFDGITVLEPAALFRWYFLKSVHVGIFAQVDAGASLILEDSAVKTMFLGGLRGGIRLPLRKI